MFHVEQLATKIKYFWKTTPDLLLFVLLVLMLPIGSRRFLITLVPYSNLVFNEWSSAFIYATDFIAILIIIFWLRRIINFHIDFRKSGRLLGIITVLFCLISLVSGFMSPYWTLGLYGSIRFILYVLIFLYGFYNIVTLRRRLAVAMALLVAGSFQALVAIWQFINQQSVGLAWLGESRISTDINNVAEIIYNGTPILRAYGTFPHPNVLAYYLLAALFIGFYAWIKISNKYFRLAGCFLLGSIFIAYLLTFSRSAWLAGSIALVISIGIFTFLKIRLSRHQKHLALKFPADGFTRLFLPIIILLVMVVGSVLVLRPILADRLVMSDAHGDMAVSMRAFLSGKGTDYGYEKPVLGWGARTFVPNLALNEGERLPAWMMQPIHNSWIALFYELGFFGVLLFIAIVLVRIVILFKTKNVPRGTLPPACDILYVSIITGLIISGAFLMLYDHYILDVHQASLLFWNILGL